MKRLVSVHLKNWCQHRDLEVKFKPGLNGIFGKNGSGKSNIMKAVRFALTGTLDTGDAKEEHVYDRIKDKEKSFVSLVYTVDGYEFTVTRGLKGCGSAKLEREGQEPITKVDDVNRAIEQSFGKFKQLNNYSFVPQGELFNWLMLKDADRIKWFAALFGVANCEAIWDAVGQQALTDTRMLPTLEDNRDALRTKIGEFELRIQELSRQISATEDKLLDEATAAGFEQKLKNDSSRSDSVLRMKGLKTEHASLKAKGKLLAAQEAELQSRVSRQMADVMCLEPKAAAAEQYQVQLSLYETYREEKKAAESRYKTALAAVKVPAARSKPKEPTAEDKQQREDLISRRGVIKRTLTTALDGSGLCGSCQQPISADYLGQLKTELENELPPKLSKLEAEQGEHAAWLSWSSDWLRSQDKAASDLKYATERLKSIKPVAKPEPVDSEQASKELAMAKLRLKTSQLAMLAAGKAYSAVGGELTSVTRNYKKLAEFVRSVSEIPKTELDTIKGLLADSLGAATLLPILNQSQAELLTHKQDMLAVLQEKQAAFDRSSDILQWVELLENSVRPFFHRSGPPKEVSLSYLRSLESSVNTLLGEFNSPFSIKADDSLNFLARKKRGEFRPAKRLSGGEKTVLSLAFWLAVQSIFSAELGVLCLDEPTQHLDQRNVEFLTAALERLNSVLAGRNIQLLMVTHEIGMKHVFGNVIEL